MKCRRVFVVLALFALGASAMWPRVSPATAQEGVVPAATLVAGTCETPGDTVAALRDPTVRDGGDVLVSVTTIDLSIDDILGDAHAIVLTDGDAMVACGDVAGSADNVYIGIAASGGGRWGGIAWLHARGEQTQVIVFLNEGLGGGVDGPPPEPTEEPTIGLPPAETPTALATRTPRAEDTPTPGGNETVTPGAGGIYTSPSYGYSLAYDNTYWRLDREESRAGNEGPLDILALSHAYTYVTLVGETGRPGFSALDLCDVRLGQFEANPKNSDITVREATSGDEDHATVVFDYTYTDDLSNDFQWTTWIGCYHAPDDSVLLTFYFETSPPSFEQMAPVRESLVAGLTFPGN